LLAERIRWRDRDAASVQDLLHDLFTGG